MLGQIIGISGPGASGEAVNTTTLDSTDNYETFVGDTVDPGEVSVELAYDPTHATHTRLNTYLGSRVAKTYTVTDSTGNAESFSAIVNGVSREIAQKDMNKSTVTLKVSGNPGFST